MVLLDRWGPVGRVLLAAAGAALMASGAAAQDARIEAETGQDRHIWPPDPLFTYQHVKLEVTIPDMTKPQFTGRERLTVAPLGAARESIELRAGEGLKFSTITLDGKPLQYQFEKENERLTIRFPGAMPEGKAFTLVIDYAADRPGGNGKGMTFSKDSEGTPEFDPMLHTQGQPEDNHNWFAIHDFPNVRLTSEVVATVPDGFEAVSNGRVLSTTRRPARGGEEKGTVTYHWLHDKPHAPYLIVLCVGNFDVVNVGGPQTARPGLWLPVYGPRGSAAVLKRNFATTPEMVAAYEKLFDEPYPWDKYANVLCRGFAAGAMENSSCTTFSQGIGLAGRGGAEGVNAHELCHQWFGDLCGYKGWEHTWLGEGWATFGEALWAEHRRGREGYQRAIAGDAGMTRGFAGNSFPKNGGMVSNLYTNPNQRFFSPADSVYQKGGWFLHSLRMKLGDDVFWAGVRLYLHRFHFQQCETDDFRHCLEEASGLSLERYFQQFAYRPGLPRLRVDLTWDDAAKKLGVAVEQTQKINADNPAYGLSVPILLDLGEGKSQTVSVDTDQKLVTTSFEVENKPVKVVVDPSATVLCESKIRQPLGEEAAWWMEQLRTGPTEFARLQAAEELVELGGPRVVRGLLGLVASGRGSSRELAGAALMDVWARAGAPAVAAK